MKGMILFLSVILFINVISAADPDFTFKIGDPMDFKIPCTFSGAPCNVSAFCLLTLKNSVGTYVLNNAAMTHQTNGDFNYTIPGQLVGDYTGKAYCSQSGYDHTTTFLLRVTPTGDNRGVSLFLILAFSSFILFITALVLRNEYIGFISGSLILVTGVYTIIYGIANLSDDYTRAISYIFLALGALSVLVSGIEMISGIESGGNQPTDDLYDYYTDSD
jgi:hypothetical protein